MDVGYDEPVEMEEAMPAIRKTAARVARKYGIRLSAEIEDLIQAGAVGFLTASRRWRPSGSRSRSEYALLMADYAIRDHLRDRIPNKRSARRRAREVHAAAEQLSRMFGRKPTSGEMASMLGLGTAKYNRLVAGLDVAGLGDAESPGAYAPPVEELQGGPPDFAALDVERLETAIGSLPEKERAVLRLSYFSSLGSREIGRRIGFQSSYVSKLKQRGIAHLAALLRSDTRQTERRETILVELRCRPSLARKRPASPNLSNRAKP